MPANTLSGSVKIGRLGDKEFVKDMLKIAVPTSLQTVLTTIIMMSADQIMVGQLGSENIAAANIVGKFLNVMHAIIIATASAIGVVVAQYLGKDDWKNINKKLNFSLMIAVVWSVACAIVCLTIPDKIISIYTSDLSVIELGSQYMRVMVGYTLFMAIALICSTLLRCLNKATVPFVISICSGLLNIGLNYILIFGTELTPAYGLLGAGVATVISSALASIAIIIFLHKEFRKRGQRFAPMVSFSKNELRLLNSMILPLILQKIFSNVADNIYAIIDNSFGTEMYSAKASMSLAQSASFNLLEGLAIATGIIIGKKLGEGKISKARNNGNLMVVYGFLSGVTIAVIMIIFRNDYANIFNISDEAHNALGNLIIIFSCFFPLQVANHVLGTGILKSGGQAKYALYTEMIASIIGVMLAFISCTYWHFSITQVYLCISSMEVIRFVPRLILVKKGVWIKEIEY